MTTLTKLVCTNRVDPLCRSTETFLKTPTFGHFTQLKLVWVDFQKKAKWFIRRFF